MSGGQPRQIHMEDMGDFDGQAGREQYGPWQFFEFVP